MNAEANLKQRSLSAGVYSVASSRIFPIMVGKC